MTGYDQTCRCCRARIEHPDGYLVHYRNLSVLSAAAILAAVMAAGALLGALLP